MFILAQNEFNIAEVTTYSSVQCVVGILGLLVSQFTVFYWVYSVNMSQYFTVVIPDLVVRDIQKCIL